MLCYRRLWYCLATLCMFKLHDVHHVFSGCLVCMLRSMCHSIFVFARPPCGRTIYSIDPGGAFLLLYVQCKPAGVHLAVFSSMLCWHRIPQALSRCVCSCVSDSSLSVDLFCIDMCVVCVCADQIYIISAAVLQVLSRTLRYSRGRLPAPWLGSTR